MVQDAGEIRFRLALPGEAAPSPFLGVASLPFLKEVLTKDGWRVFAYVSADGASQIECLPTAGADVHPAPNVARHPATN